MVTMWQSFINYWKGYVNFTGRSTRAEFWWMRLWSIIAFVVWLVLFIIALVTDANVVNKLDSIEGKFDTDSAWSFVGALFSAPFTIIVVMIGLLILVATILPNIALTIRRYRDAGTVTWVAWVVWFLSLFTGSSSWSSDGWKIVVSIAGIFSLIGFILSVLPSDTLTGTGFIGRPKDQKLVFKEDFNDSSDDEL
ncbi:DUF805 domain-containing protein [Weissella confusa]|uniref:DUF805 domain-containing protein n=1 Tax=Weissella confusa TaxID=1583 RepID=UPI0007050EAE|nr:DUF805 domain-containing protein [Weissella confusa]MBJ7628399.1 DUF805 domain-containing protein [Weissella confusa]MBJ7649677.1 DUF805 domain-containing protein [Weissella confusa]MBJ7660789.1 DUF805 domain-containing protein [Weissella confusa]MBJ7698073.1 DUF805 domain-containing protein [Weissella confusa]MBS7550186.1 DUF805 domain-containing protein [Weissella confusa]